MNPALAAVVVAAAGVAAGPAAAAVPDPLLSSLMEQSGPLGVLAYVLLVRLRKIEDRLDELRSDVEENADRLNKTSAKRATR